MYKTIFVVTPPAEGNPFPQQCFARIDELVAAGITDGQRQMSQDGNIITIVRTWINEVSAQGWIDWVTENSPVGYPFISLTLEPV
jgi:hypothetical protein